LNLSKLLDNPKSQLIYQKFSIEKILKNDQKIQLQFYPEFLLQDVSFLPDDSTQHQMHIHQVRNHLFNLPTHCQTTVTAPRLQHQNSFFQLLIRSIKVPNRFSASQKVISLA
jgi:hypothetical protein